jgi:hypothetical protein
VEYRPGERGELRGNAVLWVKSRTTARQALPLRPSFSFV